MVKQIKFVLFSGFLTLITAPGISKDPASEPNAKPGSKSSESLAFLKMGDFRLINNNWGAKELGCKDQKYEIFINEDKSFGWTFDRGGCGGGKTKPDYPELEFGMHAFGVGSPLATSPDYSSTKILPLQIKDINSASIKVDGMNMTTQKSESYNLNFEMWFCDQHPVTGTHQNAYAELIAFWAWQPGRWGCDQSGSVKAGDASYNLCHQSDNWGGWRYYQFRMDGGSNKNYSGKLDIKAFMDYLVNKRGFSKDLWVSRFEVGSEIDDNTSGKVVMKNVTIEVNGKNSSPEFYKPVSVQPEKQGSSHTGWSNHSFSANSVVAAVNPKGHRTILRVGPSPQTAAELSRNLAPGVYVMSRLMKNGTVSRPVVVPVIR